MPSTSPIAYELESATTAAPRMDALSSVIAKMAPAGAPSSTIQPSCHRAGVGEGAVGSGDPLNATADVTSTATAPTAKAMVPIRVSIPLVVEPAGGDALVNHVRLVKNSGHGATVVPTSAITKSN